MNCGDAMSIPDSQVRDTVEKMNRSLPQMLLPNLRREKAVASHQTITHSYTVTNMTAAQIARDAARVEQSTTQEVCSDPYASRLVREGITMAYLYYGNDGCIGVSFQITATKCGL